MTTELESATLQTKAQMAAVNKINELFAKVREGAKLVEKECVEFVNNSVQIGFYLQEATGGTQLEFSRFQNVAGLDKQLNFRFAQAAVNLCNRYGNRHTFKKMSEITKELQLLLTGIGITDVAHRDKLGEVVEKNWGIWIPTATSKFNQELEKLFKEEPMDAWPQDRLESFVAGTKFTHDQHEAALKILEAK